MFRRERWRTLATATSAPRVSDELEVLHPQPPCPGVVISKGLLNESREPRTVQLQSIRANYHGLICVLSTCAPQKVDPTSRCNFFEPVFMVRPADNIFRSYPAIGWQPTAMDAWARPRSTTRIRDSESQARMLSSLIVVGNPLPQDRPKMLLAQSENLRVLGVAVSGCQLLGVSHQCTSYLDLWPGRSTEEQGFKRACAASSLAG